MEEKMIPVCTTMNKKIYDRYGLTMIDSWMNFWSDEFCLYVWCEDDLDLPQNNKIVKMNWDNVNKNWNNFVTSVNELSDDEKRFAKKAFVMIDSFKKFHTGFYIWLDADTETIGSIDTNTFQDLLNNKYLINLFDVSKVRSTGFKVWAAESGFVLINLDHAEWKTLRENIENPWLTAVKPPVESWFDGEVLRYASLKVNNNSVNILNRYTDPNRSVMPDKPWNSMWLADYIRHHKGYRAKNRRYGI